MNPTLNHMNPKLNVPESKFGDWVYFYWTLWNGTVQHISWALILGNHCPSSVHYTCRSLQLLDPSDPLLHPFSNCWFSSTVISVEFLIYRVSTAHLVGRISLNCWKSLKHKIPDFQNQVSCGQASNSSFYHVNHYFMFMTVNVNLGIFTVCVSPFQVQWRCYVYTLCPFL